MGQNEKLLPQGESFGQIGCEWMFRILKEEYTERPGEAIMRLMAQLEDIHQVIYQELEEGVQDPEGAWGVGYQRRGDLQGLGRGLTNREIYDYFTKCKIVSGYRFST